jgi:ankyrin repeat protein/cell division protein FtsB
MLPSKKRLREETLHDILDRLQVVEEEAKKLKNDNISLQKDVTTLRKDNTTLHKDVTELRNNNLSLRNDNLSLNDRNLSLQSRVTSLKKSRHEIALIHLSLCIAHRDRCELDLKNFRIQYPNESVINANPILHARLLELITAKNEAWYTYFRAYDAAHPKTLEDVLWVVAKAGFVKEVAPLMNLSKVTRNCIHLQPIMMNVKLGRYGRTQLHHCAENGLTTSVKRLLSIRNINVNVKDNWDGYTPLHWAVETGHVEIIRLLLQNGADVNAKSNVGHTPLHCSAWNGHVDILHLLVENGANLEVQNIDGNRALHFATYHGNLPLLQELISRYHVDINARDNDGRTALSCARMFGRTEISTFLRANGGVDGFEDDEEEEEEEEEI